MKFKLICVGKIQSHSPYLKIIEEYKKRLCNRIEIIEIKTEKVSKSKKIEAEAKKIDIYLKNTQVVILLDSIGKKISSKQLSNFVLEKINDGHSEICFVIGGAYGLHYKILNKYEKFSFGDLIWSHQIIRVMLIEQIYRSICKINGHPYEK